MIDLVHIHPMLVHFPIVLFLVAIAVQLLTLVRGGDLSERACLPSIGSVALILGALAALAAARRRGRSSAWASNPRARRPSTQGDMEAAVPEAPWPRYTRIT